MDHELQLNLAISFPHLGAPVNLQNTKDQQKFGWLQILSILVLFSGTSAMAAATAAAMKIPTQRWSDLEAYNRMFENNNTQHVPGAGLEDCLLPDLDFPWHSAKTDRSGQVVTKCQPDTLYTWLPIDRLQSFQSVMGHDVAWVTSSPAIYAAKGPLASFGYGSVSVRFKLKKGVKFKVAPVISEKCSEISESEKENTVFVRIDPMDTLADYTFCSPQVLHSWSYGTQPHYDEMVRDLRVLKSLYEQGIDLRGKMELYSSKQGSDFFRKSNLDVGVDFTFEKLVSNFASASKLIRQGPQLFVNPNLGVNSAASFADHFQSRERMYFMRQ